MGQLFRSYPGALSGLCTGRLGWLLDPGAWRGCSCRGGALSWLSLYWNVVRWRVGLMHAELRLLFLRLRITTPGKSKITKGGRRGTCSLATHLSAVV